MTKTPPDLAALRREIDAIDDALHDLIMKRTKVVEAVRDLKMADAVKIRPAREAQILYRLIARHRGAFPKRELIRIWRELIVATLSFEGPFSVAVHAEGEDGGYFDLARDQYGSHTPMHGHGSARRVIDAVRSGEASVGVLPLPTQDESQPWWPHLAGEKADTPRIIARLPFAGPGNGRTGSREALVICPLAQEASGRDRSYLVIDAAEDLSRPKMRSLLPAGGLEGRLLATWHDQQRPQTWLHLIESGDCVGIGDPRLGKLAEAGGKLIKRVLPIGGYAIPLTPEELATKDDSP